MAAKNVGRGNGRRRARTVIVEAPLARQWPDERAPHSASGPISARLAVAEAEAPGRRLNLVGSAERELVERLRAGDGNAFDLFAGTYVPGLYRFVASRMTRDLDLVADVVQAALAKAIEHLDGYRGEAPLFTWLCACCRNEIAGHYRRAARRPAEIAFDDPAASAAAAGAEAVEPEAEERLLRLESAELVHAALDHLPERYARALEWKYFEGVSVGEVARRLDTSEKAAESLLGRARVAFREAYLHLDGTWPPAPAVPHRAENE